MEAPLQRVPALDTKSQNKQSKEHATAVESCVELPVPLMQPGAFTIELMELTATAKKQAADNRC
jgi:hypothetical protein